MILRNTPLYKIYLSKQIDGGKITHFAIVFEEIFYGTVNIKHRFKTVKAINEFIKSYDDSIRPISTNRRNLKTFINSGIMVRDFSKMEGLHYKTLPKATNETINEFIG